MRTSARRIVLTLAVVSGLGLAVWSCFMGLAPICDENLNAELASPDGKHVARLTTRYCNLGFGNASNRRLLSLGAAAEPKDKWTLVFRAWDERDNKPELVSIRWTSPTDLLVTLNIDPDIDIPVIDASLHEVQGVKIKYRFGAAL